MEKRLFLAIGLSMLVVWLWSASAPKPIHKQIDDDRLNVATDRVESAGRIFEEVSPSPIEPVADELKATDVIEERNETISSSKIEAEFSNIGGALNRVIILEYDSSLPIINLAGTSEYDHVPFTLDKITDNEIQYSYIGNGFRIVKSYHLKDDDFVIEASTQIYNTTNMSKLIKPSNRGYVIEMSNLNSGENVNPSLVRDKALFEYAIYTQDDIHRKANAHKFAEKEEMNISSPVNWAGFRDRYFCALIKPQYDTSGYAVNVIDENRLEIGIVSKEVSVAPQDKAIFNSIIFVGPEEAQVLRDYQLGFEKIKRYYRFGLFDGVSKIIEGMMHWINKFVPNWGVCILIISTIIYFAMYPLTLKGMLSMKRMQSLQPKMAQLKEKYKDNPQKMNKEMMGLYKEHKVNPLGGCLPILLQMPVFIGLYQVLWRSVSFKGADFLWIKDLSEPDRLFIMPFSLPFLGNEFNLLPIIMMVVMFVQQKLTSKNMVISDPAQATQQKMMTTIMPVFIGAIFYKFASGLTLYFTMFYLFSTFTQWKMSNVKKGA